MSRYTHGHHDSVLRSHRWRTVCRPRGIAAGWRAWSQARDGWFVVVHGEILGRP